MRHLLVCILFFCSSAAFAQQVVRGTVKDENNQSLPGVNILLKGTTHGTVTGADGTYLIDKLEINSVLSFSFIGYISQDVPVDGKSVLDIQLVPDIQTLQEIIVTGYGVQKKSVATASVSKVESKDLQGFGVARVDQALNGQVAGVTFKTASGQPGSAQNIFIRGIGTNGDNSPLVIVDGLVANDGILSSLNPSDIESIQVLKDAASTAIYGSRGANGIIIVSTKKAKSGEARLTYNGSYGIQQAWRVPEMMDASQYVTAVREKYLAGKSTLPPGFPDESNLPNNTSWMKEIFEPGSSQTHQLSVAKGNETSQLFTSLSYFDQKGIISPEKSNAKRITARLNSESRINKVLSFGENIFLVHATNQRIPENNAFGTPIADALVYDPITPMYDDNAQYGFAQSPYVQKEYINPLSRIFISESKTAQDGVTGNVFLKFDLTKNLTFKSDGGIDYNYYNGNGFTPSYQLTPAFINELNDIYEYSSKVLTWQWENYATYTQTFGKHSGDVTAGTTLRRTQSKAFGASSSGIPEEVQFDPNFQYIDNTPDTLRRSTSNGSEIASLRSVFARLNYNYDEKYLLTLTVRRDGSSKFGENNRYGLFPSVSVGWVASRESFWPKTAVNFFKLRTSYGVNGSDRIGDLRYAAIIARTGDYQFGKPGNQTVYQGFSTPYLDNPNVKWEQSKQLDIGMEFGIFDDQLTIELDYYTKATSGLLMASTTAIYVGNNPPIANVGEVVNKGFELDAKYRKTFGELKMQLGLTASTLNNKVTQVNSDGYIDGYTWPVRNTVITRMEVGQPIGFFRGYKTAGIFSSQEDVFSYINSNGDPIQPRAVPGDLKFVDVNGDGLIDSKDITNIGKPWADFQWGLSIGLSFRQFDMRALFASSIGNDIFRSYERQDIINTNYQSFWLDRWSDANTGGQYPRFTTNDVNNNSRASDFYVEDGSYLRLKNLQIGYQLPMSILNKMGMQSLRTYVSFDNLLTLTGYKGFDPEIGTSGWILDTGIDKGFYPQLRSIGFGLNVTF